MTPETSLVHAYLKASPETRIAFSRTLQGGLTSGTVLVDKHLRPMTDWVYGQIRERVGPQKLTAAQARMYIKELSVFARYNAAYLRQAAASVEAFCPALAHELYRNFLEEGGEPGKVPAHYVLYTTALLSDLDLLVTGHVPAPETQTLLLLHERMVNSHQPSNIAGGYYATEGVAIAETELLREITNRYGELTTGASGPQLEKLDDYYRLHLDDDHDAAPADGLSVEAAHIEGLAGFLRKSETFRLDLPQALTGFLEIFEGMAQWWTQLAYRAQEMVR
ncbi:DUF3865 domain-containing protein [Streptomyces triculaminicus]|uniref:DUF3865 domain-containing protein n=1 Tax=Streptomyces triculaminicus TaxID=2816232 RepID=UPI0037D178CB